MIGGFSVGSIIHLDSKFKFITVKCKVKKSFSPLHVRYFEKYFQPEFDSRSWI